MKNLCKNLQMLLLAIFFSLASCETSEPENDSNNQEVTTDIVFTSTSHILEGNTITWSTQKIIGDLTLKNIVTDSNFTPFQNIKEITGTLHLDGVIIPSIQTLFPSLRTVGSLRISNSRFNTLEDTEMSIINGLHLGKDLVKNMMKVSTISEEIKVSVGTYLFKSFCFCKPINRDRDKKSKLFVDTRFDNKDFISLTQKKISIGCKPKSCLDNDLE